MSSLLAGCGPKGGVFSPTGYQSTEYAYQVGFVDPATKTLAPPPWQLDNFVREGAEFTEKTEGAYLGIREIDENNDGVVTPSESKRELIFDLKLRSSRDDGVIWSKAHPVRFVDRERDLRVVLNGYVDSLSGTGYFAQGNLFSLQTVKERTFTTVVRATRDLVIDRHAAVEAIVELAETEKLKVDPKYRGRMVKIVFTRFEYVQRVNAQPAPGGWPAVEHGPKSLDWDVTRRGLLVLGYSNTAEAFEEGVPAFDALVQRVRFARQPPEGSTPRETAAPPSASAGAGTPAPPAAPAAAP